jgi:hypothetical protein
MDIHAGYMMWFYMYYMEASLDNEGGPDMYPIYKMEMDKIEFTSVCKVIISKLIEDATDGMENLNISDDSELDSDNKSENESETDSKNEIYHAKTKITVKNNKNNLTVDDLGMENCNINKTAT